MILKKNFLLLWLIAVVFVAGCNMGSRLNVTGNVTFSDDGAPLTTGTVVMESASTRVTGRIDKNGFFSLGEMQDGDGVPFGTYKVSIASARETLSSGLPGAYLIDAKYERPESSGLTFEAKKGGQKIFEIVVDRPKNIPSKR